MRRVIFDPVDRVRLSKIQCYSENVAEIFKFEEIASCGSHARHKMPSDFLGYLLAVGFPSVPVVGIVVTRAPWLAP
jgi:hypothetical protein